MLALFALAQASTLSDCIHGHTEQCAVLDEQHREALSLWQKACELGDADACLEVALAHADTAPWRSPVHAHALELRACGLGDAEACSAMAVPQIAVTDTALLLNGQKLLPLSGGRLAEGDLDRALITVLHSALDGSKAETAQLTTAGTVPFETLKAVLYTVGQAGIGTFSIVDAAAPHAAHAAGLPVLSDQPTTRRPIGENGLAEYAIGGAGGSLPKEAIQKVVTENISSFKACYEQGLGADPALAGKAVVRFVISADGTVTATKLSSSELDSAVVNDCLIETAAGLTFPAIENGAISIVSYPFVFQPG